MNRRDFLSGAIATAGGFVLASGGCTARKHAQRARKTAFPSSKPPNLLLFVTDDQRADALGAAGNGILQTPHLDALAQDGVLFENNFCTTPLCMSSRASIYTGLYASHHGIISGGQNLEPSLVQKTYINVLRNAGYRIGFLGKLHLGNVDDIKALCDYWWGWYDPDYFLYKSEDGLQEFHLTAHLADRAIEFIEMDDPRPFCLTVNFKAPHVGRDAGNPFQPDPRLASLYQDADIPLPPTATPAHYEALPSFVRNSEMRRRWSNRFDTPENYERTVKDYYRLVAGVDAGVGRIMRSLRLSGMAQDTVIMYTSDNGYFLGEKGLSDKHLIYEEAIRTPLLIWDPRLPESCRGRRESRMSLNIDLAPTLLDLAGAPAPQMDGQSLVPLLRNESPPWRDDWFFEHYYDAPGFPDCQGVRSGQWAYVRYIEESPVYEELFDLKSDPSENINRASEPSASPALEAMRARYQYYANTVIRTGRLARPAVL